MAPRKKRSRPAPKASYKAKPVIEKIIDTKSSNNAANLLLEQHWPARRERTASKHKKFGKFRCLLEGTDSTENDPTLKSEEEETSNLENETGQDFESAVSPDEETEIVSALNVNSELACFDNEAIQPPAMENNENSNSNLENTALEVSQKFSTLSVSTETDTDSALHANKVQETTPGAEEVENIITPDDMYDISNINTEYTVECVAEEVIPVLDEQEIEIGNSSDTETVQDNSVSKESLDRRPESHKIEEQFETAAAEAIESLSKLKVSKAPKQKAPKIKAPVRKKPAAPKSDKKQPKKRSKRKNCNSDSDVGPSIMENSVRRSNRIKSITVSKQRSKGQGLVKPKSQVQANSGGTCEESDASENSNLGQVDSEKGMADSSGFVTPSSGYDSDHKPVKVKSRWRRSSELEMGNSTVAHNGNSNGSTSNSNISSVTARTEITRLPVQNGPCTSEANEDAAEDEAIKVRLKQFVHLKENLYLTERVTCKEAKKMTCDCFLTPEEMERGEMGCGEDCLNRLLMIECSLFCPVSDRCTNKRFQKSQFSPCQVFRTEKKGLGIRATANIPYGEFILEYVGEVIGPDEFEDRATEYSKDKNPHYYFMSLRSDAVIDATQKGNVSRFINHSCEPNAETQKWTVNGELRIGFFSKRTILAGEEITFDYQFQRYGKEAQKCFCEASTCRGWLGEEPDDEEEEDEDEDEEEEEEEEEQVAAEAQEEEDGDEADREEREDEAEKEAAETESLRAAHVPQERTAGAKNKLASAERRAPASTAPVTLVSVAADPKGPLKKGRKKLIRRKVRAKDIFDDVDVDEEIEMLVTTGLKNQAHTLKLSRLMVRANDASQRTALLRILRHGEFPCRRLFLDYHGLRLIHGWMNDAQQLCKADAKQEPSRLELLQTLATLPISNKTVLQDSKVLSTVERWSAPSGHASSGCGLDSESNSPNVETDSEDARRSTGKEKEGGMLPAELADNVETEAPEPDSDPENDIRRSVGMDAENIRARSGWFLREADGKGLLEAIVDSFGEEADVCCNVGAARKPPLARDYGREIRALASKLLEVWSVLKEVFRIPKKERIEQMKEHEREADRGYKAGLEHDAAERKGASRYRTSQRHHRIEKVDPSERLRRHWKEEERTPAPSAAFPRINKHERRKLFAMRVEQEEIERRLKQREMWRQHELYCLSIGADPRFTAPFDPARDFHCVWNPQTGQWQNYSVGPLFGPAGPRFNAGMSYPYSPLPVQPVNVATQPPPPNAMHPPPSMGIGMAMGMGMPVPVLVPSNVNVPPPNMQPYPGAGSSLPVPVLPSNRPFPHPAKENSMKDDEDATEVKFAGPVPPPVRLPPKWKCARDKYGRPYYYHVRIRLSQWEPPELSVPVEPSNDPSDSTSSSETSSLSSDSSSDNSDENDDDDDNEDDDDEPDDTKLLLEIKRKFQQMDSVSGSSRRDTKECNGPGNPDGTNFVPTEPGKTSTLDERLKEEFHLSKSEPSVKRKRAGLVTEIYIISPRSEEDKTLAKENLRKYKENKERLRRQKEANSEQNNRKRIKVTVKSKKHKSTVKTRLKEAMDVSSENARKIKEAFRSSMAGIMVGILNPFRKPDCKEGRITNTEDFKHLARKLTHFVMLKELKHCRSIEELTCTESVKSKAREFVRKYMSKFGETYTRPKDDADY